VSLVTSLVLLVTFKWTSNQRAIANTKRQVLAGLFELRLFQDDPLLMLRAAGGLLAQQVRYLRYALVPVLWVAIPLSILFAHLETYYGYDALRPGQQAVVIVHARGDGPPPQAAPTLEAPPGVRVETPCVWAPSRAEGAWRIAIDREGDYELRVIWNPQTPSAATFTTRLRTTTDVVARQPFTPGGSVLSQWLHPAATPLPADAPIDSIEIGYPARAIAVAGLAMPWWAVFFGLTTVFVLLGRAWFQIAL
jgi:hypothetical protein